MPEWHPLLLADKFYCDLRFFGLRDFVYFQNVMLFSEKCADLDGKSYYACCNSSRPSLFAKVPLLGESTKGKQNAVDCKSGRKRHTPCSKYSNFFSLLFAC